MSGPQGATGAGTKEGGGGIKRILLIVAVVVLAAGAAFGGAKLAGPKPAGGEEKAAKGEGAEDSHSHEEKEKEEEPKGGDHEGGHIVPLEVLVVNVRGDAGDEARHLRLAIGIELKEAVKDEEELKPIPPRARDAAISYLRTLTYEEVSDPDRLEDIRAELTKRIKKAIPKPKVKRILLTDYVVQ